VNGGVRQGLRDPVVDQVDRAARGARAVEQGRRAAEDLDPVDQQRLVGDGVVVAGCRGIADRQAVFQDADPRTGQAPDDRPRRPRTVVAGVHARLVGQGLADGHAAA
jgi:hypothetical protein